MNIGRKLKKRAKELKLSDAEIARQLGIEPRRYSHYATGRNEPSLIMLKKICKILDISADELLSE